ncbi:hypothetical protein B296_00016481 [Ensete ventricosum]|uniref:Uncharacterized protein n=1 Tax=Ensete ventricosum TaxID=4639 RepID=A0A426ZLR0_ENSVE|nr:hypothetical protein B296_00016481 [Ensete ventricosum]
MLGRGYEGGLCIIPTVSGRGLRRCSLLARDADRKEGRDSGGEEWQTSASGCSGDKQRALKRRGGRWQLGSNSGKGGRRGKMWLQREMTGKRQ